MYLLTYFAFNLKASPRYLVAQAPLKVKAKGAPQDSVAVFRVSHGCSNPPKVSFTDGLIGGAMERRMYPMIRYLL